MSDETFVNMNSNSDNVLSISGLTKIYRDFWQRPKVRAVSQLDMSLQRGEVLGLLGPNGSGKSTAIKMILGLLQPTAGRISILGTTPDDPAVRARIGYLPELSHLYRYLTPHETLELYGGLFSLPRQIWLARSAELLEMVGLTEAAHRPVGEFSKGMARRVGLAQALINNPDIVILDEPTSGLDPLGRHDVKEIVRTLAAAGKSVLLSSHLLGEVEDVCDRVVILYRGQLQAEGRLDQLLARREQVRLTLPEISTAELDTVCAAIAAKTGTPPTVDHPVMTLEEYFLEIVARAGAAESQKRPPAPTMAAFLKNHATAEDTTA